MSTLVRRTTGGGGEVTWSGRNDGSDGNAKDQACCLLSARTHTHGISRAERNGLEGGGKNGHNNYCTSTSTLRGRGLIT